ncbi:MAG TPA: AmmeMemoRadiSam system protein B [Planctomycetes bacterium]|nr:AmmeMemoRadiSam system protein B [Planctomycetota bacterium]
MSEVAREVEARHGLRPPLDQLRALVLQLDQACLLEGPRLEERLEAFHSAPRREPACVGSYPGEPAELRAFLNQQWTRAGGPGGPPEPSREAPVRALISPHIDPHRGGHAYAWAWRAVAEAPAELFVIFGTSHTGTHSLSDPAAPPSLYALTRKSFATPLGEVPTDLEVTERLLAAYEGPDDLLAGEFHHRAEHSIEFQTVYLRALLGERARILPILCAGFGPGQGPDDPRFQAFHEALRTALAPLPRERVCFVAAVDFAHKGELFDEPPFGEAELAPLARADRETLRLALEDRDPSALHEDIARDGDPRNICGHAPLVALLEALRDEPLRGELLCYDAWHDGVSAVSFASAVYRGDP